MHIWWTSEQRCNVHSKSAQGLNNSKEDEDWHASQTLLSAAQSTPDVFLLMSVSGMVL